MNQTPSSRQLSVFIARNVGHAYDFLSDPLNFPKWASGLGSLKQQGECWIAETPDGPTQLRFSERNTFGVLDHWVVLESGDEIYIPMRVVAHGAGCELLFTLFRQPGMSPDKFEDDAQWVERDLLAAKNLLESE